MPGRPENLTPFTKDNQPTPEEKSAGWEKRRTFKYWKKEYEKMSYVELTRLAKEMKTSDKYTTLQFKAITYVLKGITDFRYVKDDRDREEGRATQRVEHEIPPITSYNLSKKEYEKIRENMLEEDDI